ncbi:MAG: enoyl-CoA hydratase/isomerase family protein [Planctomycetes bacterium]|nr:enoyl-CoA hydratase/isomerase family protein [Planctomycetota bacterium]
MTSLHVSASIGDLKLARIILDRPKGNVLTLDLMRELIEALRKVRNMKHLRMVTLEASGAHFSYGADVAEHKAEVIKPTLETLRQLVLEIAGFPIPVAALVKGVCFGGAFEVVLAAHFIFADQAARFALPEVKLGVLPPAACALIVKKAGQALADRMILAGEELTGAELYQLGLVTKTFHAPVLFDAVSEWFKNSLEHYSAEALRQATAACRAPLMKCLEERLIETEHAYLDRLMATHDANEGIAAFLEKRPAQWSDA